MNIKSTIVCDWYMAEQNMEYLHGYIRGTIIQS